MIRLACEADVPAILQIYAPYILNTTYTFEYEVPGPEAFTARFRQITEKFPWLVWEEQGKVLGYAYGSLPFERAAYAWCSEISIYLAPEAQGKGIGRALYTVLEALMAAQGYQLVYSLITTENTGSVSFHEKMGYHFDVNFPNCGYKFGRWLGVIWMEKRLKSVETPTHTPIDWSVFMQTPQKYQNILAKLPLS